MMIEEDCTHASAEVQTDLSPFFAAQVAGRSGIPPGRYTVPDSMGNRAGFMSGCTGDECKGKESQNGKNSD